MKFTEFDLNESLLEGIKSTGYENCTPVQEQVLKTAIEGNDMYVQSQTGTGKTAAYLITLIQEILASKSETPKKALIMVPTRELAVQVEEEARKLLSATKLKTGSFYGGVGYARQTKMLENGVDIMIGTPGRVIDLREGGQMKFDQVQFLVIDEADRMFDMGFYPDLRKLLKLLPSDLKRQTMLFSATLNTYVKNLAWEYTKDAKEIEIEAENITVDEIDQMLLHVASADKMKLLLGIVEKEKPESFIVFCNTKRSCEVVAKRMKLNGIECEFIIGDLPQSKRLQVLDSFKRTSLKCLVATDVAARGIDVDDLSMVINYDLPNEAENYVHRIGRTARAGRTGKAYTFCSEQDVYNLPAIEKYIDKTIPSEVAFEDMMSVDKSAGVYIKTGNFRDQKRDSRDSRNRNYQGKKRSNTRSQSKRSEEHKNNSYKGSSDRNYKGSKSNNYKGKKTRHNQNNNRTTTENMANLSFDERMKLYKEKYGNQSSAPQQKKQPSQRNNTKKRNSYTTKQNNYNKNTYKKGSTQQNKRPTPQSKSPVQKKKTGFLGALKSIFGKK